MTYHAFLKLCLALQAIAACNAFYSPLAQPSPPIQRIIIQRQASLLRKPQLLLQGRAAKKTNALEGEGMPSKPGWKSESLNRLTEWAGSTIQNRPIICEYEPRGWWLWSRWNGTVLQLQWVSVVAAMLVGLGIDFWARSVSSTTWRLLEVPPKTDPLIQSLVGVEKLWTYQLTFCTFILTFFLSHAYTYWQKVYNTTRMIQGRINDFCMLITMAAKREERSPTESTSNATTPSSDSNNNKLLGSSTTGTLKYCPRSKKLVRLCTRLIRMSHTMFWAATPTSSNGLSDCEQFVKLTTEQEDCPIPLPPEEPEDCPFPVDDEHIGPMLLNPYGLKALVQSQQLTSDEANALLKIGLPPSQYAYTLLEWVGIYSMKGLQDGHLVGGNGFEENLVRQLTSLRASMFDVDDFRAGRMPLAYVQLVQVLVDSLIGLAPFALYPELGSFSIPLVGLMALFFRGLLALSKSFLDPFGIEGFDEQNIRVDVLVSELNFGASKRWIKAGGSLPATNF